jgi:methyl-accepting chemotaxis protein
VRNLTGRLSRADLNTLLEPEHNDEIGDLATAFNQFVLRLRHILLEMREGSAATTAKSGEIREIASNAKTSLTEQHQCAEEASSAVAQLSREIANASSHTDEASQHAHAATEAARHGNELVASAVAMIHALSEDTRQSASRISTLSERASQIGSIVGVIDEIAAGTNLLALNASIEAARAGEHGRGFAVVAAEVRRLAERTSQATQQVSALVSGIAEETGQAAQGIQTACARASEGAETIAGLSSTFERITQLVVEVNSRVGRIAQDAREESAAANSVSETMFKVANSAQQSANGAGIVVTASGDLLSTASTLEGLVRQFALREIPQDHGTR